MNIEMAHQALIELFHEEPDRVIVYHDPMSERYLRAQDYLEDLMMDGTLIGYRIEQKDNQSYHAQLVFFCQPSPLDQINNLPGEYGVFRVILKSSSEETVYADCAELFGFYDNDPDDDDDGNHGFRNLGEARKFMRTFSRYTECG